jgi:hypothetical protein
LDSRRQSTNQKTCERYNQKIGLKIASKELRVDNFNPKAIKALRPWE